MVARFAEVASAVAGQQSPGHCARNPCADDHIVSSRGL